MFYSLLKSRIDDPFGGFDKGHVKFKNSHHLDHHLKNSSFSCLSGSNPPQRRDNEIEQDIGKGYHALHPEEKKSYDIQHNGLVEEKLKELGATYHKLNGYYDGEEASFLVYHSPTVTPDVLDNLANNHHQDSIFHWNKGQGHTKYLGGDKHNQVAMEFGGHVINPNLENYYSEPVELGPQGRFQGIMKSVRFGFTIQDFQGHHHRVDFKPFRK